MPIDTRKGTEQSGPVFPHNKPRTKEMLFFNIHHVCFNEKSKDTIEHSRNTITYHNALRLSPQKVYISIVFGVSWELKWPQEKLKTMLIQNFGVTEKEYYGMLWYFLEWSILIDLIKKC